MFPNVVGLFFNTITVTHTHITMFFSSPLACTLHAKDSFCNVAQYQSDMRTLHLQYRQLPQDNSFQHKIASIQKGSGPDS